MSALRSGFVFVAPWLVTGCNGVFWGNLGVLCVTVGIFLGTVFLGRSRSDGRGPTRSSASTSHHS